MNTPAIFRFNQHPVRLLLIERQPWFVAKDVCDVLGLANSRKAITALDEDEVLLHGVRTSDVTNSYSSPRVQRRSMHIVSESGLYSLVFRSRKPEARSFRRWVTSEVLPAIRRTGAYRAPSGQNPLQFMQDAFDNTEQQPTRQTQRQRKAVRPAALPPQQAATDVRHIPYDWVQLNGGRMRTIVVAGTAWYHLADAKTCIGGSGTSPNQTAQSLPQQHRRLLWLYGNTNPTWCVDDTGLRLVMAAKGISATQLTLDLARA